jgi:hypothetical protein
MSRIANSIVQSRWPTESPLPLYELSAICVAVLCVEAVREPVRRASTLRLRPQKISIPAEVRGVFIKAVIAGFAGFAVLGLFTAVYPGVDDAGL